MRNLIADVVSLFNNTDWNIIKQYPEIYSIDGSLKTPSVHVEDVAKLFKHYNYIANYRDSNSYPIELSVIIQGVKFFSIHTLEEFTNVP